MTHNRGSQVSSGYVFFKETLIKRFPKTGSSRAHPAAGLSGIFLIYFMIRYIKTFFDMIK